MASQYTTESGNPVQLGRQLGKGGEGVVFEVLSHPGLVAKIYQPRPDQIEAKRNNKGDPFGDFLKVSRDKLLAMIAASPKDPNQNHTSIAWPKHILLSNGAYVGFLMPLIDLAMSDKIYNFCHPRARKKEHPSFTRQAAFRTATNFANAVRLVHSCGHVVGDMNHANILCQENGYVTLIDTDSFAIAAPGGRVFPCTVAMPEYLAPEVQGCSDLTTLNWQSSHDCFALAIHVFQLLFNRHPFDGVLRGGAVASKPVNLHLIEKRVFPYAQNRLADPPQKSGLMFSRLSPAMQQAFITTFQDGAQNPLLRFLPADWSKLLMAEEATLIQCSACGDWNEPHLTDCLNCGGAGRPHVGFQTPLRNPNQPPPVPSFVRPAQPQSNWRSQLVPVVDFVKRHPKASAATLVFSAGYLFLHQPAPDTVQPVNDPSIASNSNSFSDQTIPGRLQPSTPLAPSGTQVRGLQPSGNSTQPPSPILPSNNTTPVRHPTVSPEESKALQVAYSTPPPPAPVNPVASVSSFTKQDVENAKKSIPLKIELSELKKPLDAVMSGLGSIRGSQTRMARLEKRRLQSIQNIQEAPGVVPVVFDEIDALDVRKHSELIGVTLDKQQKALESYMLRLTETQSGFSQTEVDATIQELSRANPEDAPIYQMIGRQVASLRNHPSPDSKAIMQQIVDLEKSLASP